MKTKLTTIFKKPANTPPVWVCLLFALVISTNCWADVTAEWGAFGTSTTALPSNISSTIEGDVDITVAANFTTQSLSLGGKQNNAYQINSTGNHIDISTSSGTISSVGIYIWCPSGVKVQFSSSSTYSTDNLTGSPFTLTSEDDQSNTTLQELTSSNIPSNAKSARIYIESDNWKSYLYYITVTVSNIVPCTKYTATFSPAGTETSGAVPSSISKCAELTFKIPNSGTLVKTGYDFVGWDDGSGADPYVQGDSYTMPEDGVTFTAVWTEHIVPAVTDLNSSLSDDDITLSWTNYNKFNMASVSYVDAALNNYTVANGALICNYTHGGGWTGPCLELTLPRSMDHVTSIDMQYTHTNSVSSSGGIITYLKSGVEDANGKWYDSSDDAHTYLTKTADPTDIQITPDAILWSTTSNAYSSNYHINIIGFACNLGSASTGTFSIKDIYVNTSDNQTTLDEIKVIRKKGSAPASIGDGTQVYSGVLNTFTDEDLEDGSYYYAVYAREGSLYSAAVVEGPIQVGTPKADPELTASVNKGVIPTTGSALLTVSKANAYDGTLEYSVSPSGVISLNETTGEITAVAAGTATITVTAPATATHYADNKSVTVTVLAAPTTNLAIGGVDGDNVTLTWDVPGKIDLRTAKTTSNYLSSSSCDSYSYITYASNYNINNNEELDVTYSVGHGGVVGVLFNVDLTSVESISFEYKGDYTGDGWDGIFPAFYNPSDERLYWEGGSHSLAETSWTSKTISPSNYLWCSGSSASGNMKELGFFANLDKEGASLSNAHMYLRNVFYHCTGMTDIDHIVIMRTTSAEATDTLSGTKIYSGKMSHFVDTDSKAAGLYYYTLFAVYENGSIPVESITHDTRVFNITYKDKGDAEFSGTHETGYPTTHSNAAATALKKASKEDYIFVGWYNNAACTGDAVTSLAAGAYDADITLYARWEQLSLHQPGKYQAPTSEGGYGRVLKSNNGHDYEVYMVTFDTIETTHYGALYAGPVAKISDGYRMFRTTSDINTTSTSLGDGWIEFKSYKYDGSDGSGSIGEFKKLDGSGNIHSARYARLGSDHYVRLYAQGYAEFAFYGRDYKIADGEYFEVRIDGESKTYEPSADVHVARYTLTPNEPHFIEISANLNEKKYNNFYGFSLQLPDVEHYTVTVAKNDNSYGTVSAASIANVRAGEATYVTDNTLYIAGTTVTATPAAATAEYTYAFDNWSGVPATITEATTVTANFTRTGNDYTLTWDLNGGAVTTAGTGAEMDATGTPSSSVAYGTAITAPVVEKEGYEFIGWDVTPAATMPAEAVTYTAQWYTPEHISSGSTTTLDNTNVRTVVNNTNPFNPIVSFDADNNGEAETCLNIQGNGYATWKAYITRGYYQARVIYGTTSGGVNIKLQVIDPETSGVVVETGEDKHTESGVKHCLAIWGLDLRNVNENKIYEIKVIDAYDGAGSLPYVSSVNIVPMSIPDIKSTAVTHLDYTNVTNPNKINVLDVDQDGNAETCMLVDGQKHADWKVTLKNKGKYFVRVMYGKESGGTNLRLYVLDKDENIVFTHPEDRSLSSSVRYETWTWSNVDLSELTENEEYIIRIEDRHGSGSKPNIAYLEIKSETVYIPTETRLDAENSISALTFATDLDIDDDGNNDKLMNLKNSTAEWMAQITPGVYNVSLIYGVPAWGIEVSVKLIDPTGEEEERYLSTNPSYYQSAVKDDNEQQLPHHHVGTTLCDLTGLTPGKKYKVQVADEWDDGCNLRVSHVLFTPIEPVAIPTERRLDITNTISSPTMATDLDIDGDNTLDELMNLNQNKGNAEWIVKITQGIYDVKLTYGAPEFSIRVVAKLIDPSGEEADRYLSADPYYYESGAENVPHYHTSTTRCDFSSITEDKIYKVVIEDAYGGTYGCELRVSHLEFARPVDTHTRTGLTVGNYGTICLPYAVEAEDIHGADLFEIDEWDPNGASLTLSQLTNNENMVAGRPYIFQATEATATFRYYAEGDEAEAGSNNGLVGSYEQALIQQNDDNYIIYNNKLYLVNSEAYVGANRAYIHKQDQVQPAPAYRRRVTLGVNGAQVATDIDLINDPAQMTKYIENGHLFIFREGKLYNAQGQLVK